MGARERGKVQPVDGVFNPNGAHVSAPSISAATDLMANAPADARSVLMQALAQNVRYTLDGTNPTATRGFQLRAGDPAIIIPICPQTQLKVIEELAGSSLQYQWGY